MTDAALVGHLEGLLADGRVAECLQEFVHAVRTDRRDGRLYPLGARAFLSMGAPEEALQVLDRCPAAQRTEEHAALRVEILEGLIEYYEELGQTPSLLAAYRRYLDARPDDARGWINLGLCHVSLPEPMAQEALECFTRATELDPANALAWYNMGVLFHQCGQIKDALRSFERSVESAPEQADAWYYQGMCHLELAKQAMLGKLTHGPKAVQCLTRALQLDPDHEPAAEALAKARGV